MNKIHFLQNNYSSYTHHTTHKMLLAALTTTLTIKQHNDELMKL